MNLNEYQRFVASVTSAESNNHEDFLARVDHLQVTQQCNLPLLLTAAIGLGSEAGEFQEIVKKILFQGKPLNEESQFHMKRELGDVLWYWANACRALDLNPQEVLQENVYKLQSRYPGGEFDAWFSENRKHGDL